ncbi:MAG: hypothetical protein HYZ26_14055 [Chloroflexi bacterium]|nr:hypothetical protein [Chloroflexota bacterium]
MKNWIKSHWTALAEIAIVILWAYYVGKPLLVMDEGIFIFGREYGMAVSTHHFWTFVKQCGACALWNGAQIGGYPAMANTYAGILHPVTAIATLVWGVVNGSKVITVASLAAAGVAQWWLARELRLGFIARMWTALLAVAGGHLAGRLELGLVSLVLSTGFTALLFAGVLRLYRLRTWGAAMLLAALTASALLSGQGYIQICMALTLPAFGFLLVRPDLKLDGLWKKYALAGVVAVLLAAPMVLALATNHFFKSGLADFRSSQPLAYALVNFVIDSPDFYRSEVLGKWPNPNLYTLYIGWLPVIFAIVAVGLARRPERRVLYYLAASVVFIFVWMHPPLLAKLAEKIPAVANFRFPSFGYGIAVTPILALAGYTLDRIFALPNFPTLEFSAGGGAEKRVRLPATFLLVILLVLNVRSAYRFGQTYIMPQAMPDNTASILASLQTDSLQWIQPPLGEQYWTVVAVGMGLKVTGDSIPWWVDEERVYPEPYYWILRDQNAQEGYTEVRAFNNEWLFVNPENQYAYVETPAGERIPCAGQGVGGDLTVTCDTPAAGTLVVHENNLHGWRAWVADQEVELGSGRWLELPLPAGKRLVTLRYRPWDAYAGFAITTLAAVFALLASFRPGWLRLSRNDRGAAPPPPEEERLAPGME